MYGVCLNKRNDDGADEAKKEPSIEQVRVRQSEDETSIRKGPWSIEEDTILVNYIATHGGGHRWNSLARAIGLKRSGKSCRLRWLNYLCPGVRRGNITLQEQITILDLYSRWGNRWSEIARHLPGRTDSEVRNYWRTRVVKKAKQLKCDVDSKQFKDALRDVWIPLLIERVQTPSETHYLTRTAHDEQLLGPGPSPSASASAHRVQHELQSPGSGTEWVNRNYSSSSSGAFPPASSSCVELQVDVHSEQLDHDVSGLYPSFDNQMFEQGNTTLPFGVGGGGDFDSLLDSSWNDGNIWLLPQLWNDLQIKDNFLA